MKNSPSSDNPPPSQNTIPIAGQLLNEFLQDFLRP